LTHLEGLYGLYGVSAAVRIARKHIAWYCGNRPEGLALRESINKAETAEQQKALIGAWFDRLPALEMGVA
jgi:tRNA-dihydrouridine synthase B